MQGWVCVHRQLLQSAVFKSERVLKVWIWCLLRANHERTRILWNGAEKEMEPGQFITGRFEGARECHMKPSTFWYQLSLLRRLGNLDIQSDNRNSLVTVVKWLQYQWVSEKFDSNIDNKLTASGQQVDTDNNGTMKQCKKEQFVTRKSAESIDQLKEKDFLLRLDDQEFPLWVRGVEALIARHNQGSTNGGFVWKPTTKSFEGDLRSLIYKPDDEKKKSLLIDASHVLEEKLNWPQYVEKCLGFMLCTSERKPIHEPFEYVLALVHKPSALISEMADGPLGPSIQKLVGG